MSAEEEEEEGEGDNEWSWNGQADRPQFKLINEAIKRILLDVVIRGHGDRLIGRWSHEPEIQKFLEDVPYMLDRISQLHLCCSQVDPSKLLTPTISHHRQHHYLRQLALANSEGSSLRAFRNFINLIGNKHHWLVRTRDQLGLTPLHKAVLFHNNPVAEYIADRYAGELAPPSNWHGENRRQTRASHRVSLLDSQDKYGRAALHYAASTISLRPSATSQRHGTRPHLYRFLVARGASEQVVDFQGRKPDFYLQHPEKLRALSIIHLANKLNASYQATVLSKTLRAGKFQGRKADILLATPLDVGRLNESRGGVGVSGPMRRCLLSVSCSELAGVAGDEDECSDLGHSRERRADKQKSNSSWHLNDQPQEPVNSLQIDDAVQRDQDHTLLMHSVGEDVALPEPTLLPPQLESARKQLVGQRILRPVLDENAKQSIKRALNEGVVERIAELTCAGYGAYIMGEARSSCWNQQCKRYVERLLPQLLESLDRLHEAIATNQLNLLDSMLNREPILARIRRPYQVGALSALHVASRLDRRSTVRRLLAKFPELVNQLDSRGATCLHWAARLPPHQHQLYHWLLAHFGCQLGSIRDSRGRLASDYLNKERQLDLIPRPTQVSTVKVRPPSTVNDILSHNHKLSNELKLIGQKEPVRARPHKAIAHSIQASQNNKKINIGEPKIEAVSPKFELYSQQCRPENTDSPSESEAEFKASEEEVKKLSEVKKVGPESDEPRLDTVSPQDQTDEKEMSDEQVLLGEMTQLELNDQVTSTESIFSEGSKASESSINRIKSVLCKAIEKDDTRPIERLILAGCGRRVMELYDVCDRPFDCKLGKQVDAYMSRSAPKLVSLIQEIHAKVHACFAKPEPNQQFNQCFNSICKLLSCNSLCMSRDCFGATPLQVCLMRCDRRLAEYLLRRQPEAASGPDHQNRSGLHYAAIALRAFLGHGPFKLTVGNSRAAGHWLVDDTTQTLYDNLKMRYEDLLGLRDKRGSTCEDYLMEHIHEPPIDELPPGLVKPEVAFKNCCPDYAQMLSNYNYLILVEVGTYHIAKSDDDHENQHSPELSLPNRSMSCETKEVLEIDTSKKPDKVYRRSSTLDDLSNATDIHVPATPDWNPKGPLRQLAPLPTVGSASGFQEGPSPILSSHFRTSLGETKKSSRRNSPSYKTKKDLQFENTTSGRQRKSSIKQPLVGGVIVPTVIHDESTRDIETYDIVSRNNSTTPLRNTGSTSRISNHSSTTDLLKTLDPRRLITPASVQTNSTISSNRFLFDDSGETSDSSSSASEAEDSRVEYLSDEFHNRVRLEKNELKKRVDQIMNEIKNSAKSSNSSRLLMSPADHQNQPSTNTSVVLNTSSQTNNKHPSNSLTTSVSVSSVSSCSSSNCSRKLGVPAQMDETPTGVQDTSHQQVLNESEVMSKNSYGQTYLHFIASRSQSPSTFYRILEHGKHLLGERDIYYRSARDVAVQFNLANNVQVLDKFIIGLFINGHTKSLQLLLNQGYSPLIHVADPDGNDIMMILKLLKLDRMVQFLLQMADFQRWRDELHTFIRHGYLGGVQELIKKSHDLIKAKSVHSRSSLHLAVLFNRVEMIDLLIANDPSCIHSTDNMNRTPLHYAFGMVHAHNSDEIKQKLMDAGANQGSRDAKMRTPKYYYIFRRDIDEIKRMELELN